MRNIRQTVAVFVAVIGAFTSVAQAADEPDTLQEVLADLESKPGVQSASSKDPDTGYTTVKVTNADGSTTTRTFRPDGSLASKKTRPAGSITTSSHNPPPSGAQAEPPARCNSIIDCLGLVQQLMNNDQPPPTATVAPAPSGPSSSPPSAEAAIPPEVIDALLAAHPGTTRERWELYERMWRNTFENPSKRESLKELLNTTKEASASAEDGTKLLADAIRNNSGSEGIAALEHLTVAVVQSQRSTEAAAGRLSETPPQLATALSQARQDVDEAKGKLRTLKGVLDLVGEPAGELSEHADRIGTAGNLFGWDELEQEGAFLESVETLGEAAEAVSTGAKLTQAIIEEDAWEVAKTAAGAAMPEGPDMLLDAGIAACEQNMELGNRITDALGCLERDCDPEEMEAAAQQIDRQVQNFGKEVFGALLPVAPETIRTAVNSPPAQWVKDKLDGITYVWENYSFDAWLRGEPIPTRPTRPTPPDLDEIIGEPWD